MSWWIGPTLPCKMPCLENTEFCLSSVQHQLSGGVQCAAVNGNDYANTGTVGGAPVTSSDADTGYLALTLAPAGFPHVIV